MSKELSDLEKVIIISSRLSNGRDIFDAANQVDLDLCIACAFVEQESKGQNIYGHDEGGSHCNGGEVTEENYKDFYHEVVDLKQKSNGVGPMQITYRGYFPDAQKKKLSLWIPKDNLVYGFTIVKNFLKSKTLNEAAQMYNSGKDNGAPNYGKSVVNKFNEWEKLLKPQ